MGALPAKENTGILRLDSNSQSLVSPIAVQSFASLYDYVISLQGFRKVVLDVQYPIKLESLKAPTQMGRGEENFVHVTVSCCSVRCSRPFHELVFLSLKKCIGRLFMACGN